MYAEMEAIPADRATFSANHAGEVHSNKYQYLVSFYRNPAIVSSLAGMAD